MPATGDASITKTPYFLGHVKVLELDLVADSGDGSFSKALGYWIDGELVALETNPGSTAPTANYDIALNDAEGFDVLHDVGADRSASTTEKVSIVEIYGVAALYPKVAASDVLTLVLSNNSVNSATVKVKLYFIGLAGTV